jgi:cytochrome P450
MLFFLAGYETTSASMCWIFHELAHNPDVQDKLYEEVEETFEKYGVKLKLCELNAATMSSNNRYAQKICND